jgi:hypothetical protein
MTSHCYVSRTSLRSALSGAVFAIGDGVRKNIPDPWFRQAELLREGRLLRIHYTFCVIEIAGQMLGGDFRGCLGWSSGFSSGGAWRTEAGGGVVDHWHHRARGCILFRCPFRPWVLRMMRHAGE